MAALSADKDRLRRGTPKLERFAVATGSTIYVGSAAMAVLATTGSPSRILPAQSATAAAASSFEVVGVVVRLEDSDGAPGSGVGDTSGTEYAIVDYGSEFLFDLHSAIQTNTSLRKNVYAGNDSDNDAAGTGCAATSGSWVKLGELAGFHDDLTEGWIAVGRYTDTNVTT